MLNAHPPLPILTTEQIQQCLEENKELILAIMECQNQGNFAEIGQYQAKLQHNLTFLAKLADTVPQEQCMQQPQVAMSQQRPDLSTLVSPLDMNDQQQKQHPAMSLQRPGPLTAKFPFPMNEQHQSNKLPVFIQQHQLVPEGMGSFHGDPSSGMQTKLFNLPDMPSVNLMGSDMGLGWS